MPLALLPLLATFLGSIIAGLAFRVLASIGFAYVAYRGISFLINSTKTYIISMFSAMPPEAAAILGLLRVDIAINIIIAAIVARLLLSGMDKATGVLTALMLSRS